MSDYLYFKCFTCNTRYLYKANQ